MLLLLTTSQSFLLLDTDTGEADVLDTGRGLYYGIARHGEHVYVAARHRLVSSTVPQEQERGEILVFDRKLRPAGTLQAPFPLRDLHEIGWHEGKLYATCSFDNLIAVYDGASKRWEQWYPLGDANAGDANHFNSFLFEQGRIWILAHNRGPSELIAFSLDDRRRLEHIDMGDCGHNMWREDGAMYTCSSSEGRIRNDRGFVHETGGFPRGVAMTPQARYIGVSGLAERAQRDMSTGKLVVRAPDWSARCEIELEGEGLVLDVQALPEGFAPDRPGALRRLLGAAQLPRRRFMIRR